MLAYDWKRALHPKWMAAGVILTVVFVFANRLDVLMELFREGQMPSPGFIQKFVEEALTGEKLLFFLPVLCTLPYSASFVEEWKSGIVKFTFCRVEKTRYLISKALTAAVSGGMILAVGALGVMVVSGILFMPLELEVLKGASASAAGSQSGLFLKLLVRYFCFGALGAETGLWLSTAADNRFMGWSGPFMAEYLLIILYERYFPQGIVVYPKEWLAPSEGWPLSGYGCSLWMLILTAFAAWAFVRSAGRRITNV